MTKRKLKKGRKALFAIKHTTLIEKKLEFIAEEKFDYNRVYGTTEEALKEHYIEDIGFESYLKLDEKNKK